MTLLEIFVRYAWTVAIGIGAGATLLILNVYDYHPEQAVAFAVLGVIADPKTLEALKWFAVGFVALTSAGVFHFLAWRLSKRNFGQRKGTTNLDSDPYVPLKEAATIAYEETLGTQVATVAEALNADDVLGYYAYALFDGKTTLYGNRPPSRKQEPIPNEEYGRCGIYDDYRVLRRPDGGRNLYENLQIKRSDLDRRIAELKSFVQEERQPPVHVDWNFNQRKRAQMVLTNNSNKTIDGFELLFRSYRKADEPKIWDALVSLPTVNGKEPPMSINPGVPYYFEFAELKWRDDGEGTIAILPDNDEEGRWLGKECGVKLTISGRDVGASRIELRLKILDNDSISIDSWNEGENAVGIEDPNRKWE
ncbi:MAG: hypothetical protein IH994_02505 [Proteobacteria bacterium]|nr:hypothetical protein [Pseudomonadota bacterium]